MPLKEDFDAAVSRSKTMTRKPDNDALLSLYALFKQATEGDISGERPGGFDFKAIAKHDAWAARKGLPQETAMQEYIALADQLFKQYQ